VPCQNVIRGEQADHTLRRLIAELGGRAEYHSSAGFSAGSTWPNSAAGRMVGDRIAVPAASDHGTGSWRRAGETLLNTAPLSSVASGAHTPQLEERTTG